MSHAVLSLVLPAPPPMPMHMPMSKSQLASGSSPENNLLVTCKTCRPTALYNLTSLLCYHVAILYYHACHAIFCQKYKLWLMTLSSPSWEHQIMDGNPVDCCFCSYPYWTNWSWKEGTGVWRVEVSLEDSFFFSSPLRYAAAKEEHRRFSTFCNIKTAKNVKDYQRLFKTYWIIYRLILKNFPRASLGDPWHFSADPDPRIPPSD